MNHPATTPRKVDTPDPISVLESAERKLADDSSKMCHLEPSQRDALRDEMAQLRTEIIKLRDENEDLQFTVFADVMYRDGMADAFGDND